MLAASIAIQDCLVVSAVGVLAGELVVLLALPEDTEPLLAPVVAVAMCA
jgi:DNA-binding cell septation regulator SpoVG